MREGVSLMGTPSDAGVELLRSDAQDAINGTEKLVPAVLSFVFGAMAAGLLTLGECSKDTTKWLWNGVAASLCAVRGDHGANDSPLTCGSPGTRSLVGSVAVVAAAIFRSGSVAGGHDHSTPEGAAAMATDTTGATTNDDYRKVAGKLRKVIAADKVAIGTNTKPGTVRGESTKALAKVTKPGGPGGPVVGNAKPKTVHGLADRMVGMIGTCDWDADLSDKDGIDHLDGTAVALRLALADVEALLLNRSDADTDAEVDAELEALVTQ